MRKIAILNGFFSNVGTVQQKAVRGVLWILLSSWSAKIIFTIQTVIVVRLLKPSDFGIMGLLFMITGMMDVVTNSGIESALIQRKEIDKKALDTAWTLSIVRGAVKYSLLYLAAAPLAAFYDTPVLEKVIKIYGLIYLVEGFRNVGTIIFTREIDFKTVTLADQLKGLLGMVMTVALAIHLKSFWALLAGYVASGIIGLIISFRIHPFRPAFRFDMGTARELFRFGRHILLSGIIIQIINRGDDALVGKVLGLDSLGYYTLAYSLATLPSSYITDAIFRVTFPTFSRLHEDAAGLRSSYLKTLKFVSLLAIPASAGIIVLGPEIVGIIYGPKWLPMVHSLQVMCIFGMIRAIVAISGGLFQGAGKPHYLTYVSFVQLLIMAAVIYPLTVKYNILGTSIAVVVPMVMVQGWTIKKTADIIEDRVSNVLRIIALPLAGSLMMAPVVLVVKHYLLYQTSVAALLGLVLIGVVAYFSAMLVLDRKTIAEAKKLILAMG